MYIADYVAGAVAARAQDVLCGLRALGRISPSGLCDGRLLHTPTVQSFAQTKNR